MGDLVLALDTALDACSVAIMHGDEELISRIELMTRGQAERLAPMVSELAAEAGVSLSAIDRIGVTRGPGAFTGLRVGLAFARGLALALNRPCIGVSTLEVLAAGAGQMRTLSAISLAGSLYVGAWEGRNEVIAPMRATDFHFLDNLSGDWTITGSGVPDLARERPDWHIVSQITPNPVVLAQLARHKDPVLHRPDPLYLRGVDAKLPGGRLLDESLA